MSKWFKEPLFHFLLLGLLVFVAYDWLSAKGSEPDEIFISRGQQENLINTFSRTWQRPPTPEEFQGLLKDYLRQEIAYRESRAMGLDQDDIVIRRRLRQKMELLAEDVASMVPPTDEQLQAYLDENPADYRVDPRLTLQQVYFSRDRRGEATRADAEALLRELNAGGETPPVEELGDPLPLPPDIVDLTESEIARLFGRVFTEELQGLETGGWAGPVESGFGLHLVYIEQRVPGRAPGLVEVRDAVQRDWLSRQRIAAVDGLYDRLAENYSIEIESLLEEETAEE